MADKLKDLAIGRRDIVMRTPAVLANWAKQTIIFSYLSSGNDSVDEVDVDSASSSLISTIYRDPSPLDREVADEVISAACSCSAKSVCCNKRVDCSRREIETVMLWVLKTLGICYSVAGRPCHSEFLELMAAEHIIDPIQQGRGGEPNKGDLDKIIQKTLEHAVLILKLGNSGNGKQN